MKPIFTNLCVILVTQVLMSEVYRKKGYLQIVDQPLVLNPKLGDTVLEIKIKFRRNGYEVNGAHVEAVIHVIPIARHREESFVVGEVTAREREEEEAGRSV